MRYWWKKNSLLGKDLDASLQTSLLGRDANAMLQFTS
jgi:hypothetical protein